MPFFLTRDPVSASAADGNVTFNNTYYWTSTGENGEQNIYEYDKNYSSFDDNVMRTGLDIHARYTRYVPITTSET